MKPAMHRTHPLEMLRRLKRYIFLLLLPVIRGLLLGSGTLAQRLYQSGWNAVFALAIILITFFQWRQYKYSIHGDRLLVQRGIFMHLSTELPINNVDFLATEHTPILSLFRAARLHVETPGGSRKHPDLSLLLSRQKAEEIFTLLRTEDSGSKLFRTPIRQQLLLAVSWSNAASGLLLAVPFIRQLGRVLGADFVHRIYQTADLLQWLVWAGAPPLAALVVWLFISGWLVAFISRLFRHGRFHSYCSGGFIITESGLLSRRRHISRRSAINGVTIQQSLPMVLLRMQAVYLLVMGYGRRKGEGTLLAAGDEGHMEGMIKHLTGLSRVKGKKIKAARSSHLRYIAPPIIVIAVTTLLSTVLSLVSPRLWKYLALAWGFISLIGLWRLWICQLGWQTSGLRFSDESIELSTYRNLSLVCVILPRYQLQEIRLFQSRFQQKNGLCNISFGIRGERKKAMLVRGLNYDEVMNCLRNL